MERNDTEPTRIAPSDSDRSQASSQVTYVQNNDAFSQFKNQEMQQNTHSSIQTENNEQMSNIHQDPAPERNNGESYGVSSGVGFYIKQSAGNLENPIEPISEFQETNESESPVAVDMRTNPGSQVSRTSDMEDEDKENKSTIEDVKETTIKQDNIKDAIETLTNLTGCVHAEIQTDISIPASANLIFSCLTSGEVPKNLMLMEIPDGSSTKGNQRSAASKKKAGQGTRKQAKPKKIAKPRKARRAQKILYDSDTDDYNIDEENVLKDTPERDSSPEEDIDTTQGMPEVLPELPDPKVEKSANIACDSCGLSYHSQEYFDKHECALPKEQRPFSCRLCDKSFTKEDMMVRHEAHHIKEMPNTCPVCFRPFAKPSKLKTHIRCHTGDKMFCTVCHKRSFTRLLELTRHEEKCREGKTGTKCSICYHAFSTQSELRQHMLTHSKEKKFHCDTCDKSFAKSYKLKEHIRSHTGEKPYKCIICSKSFARSYRLSRHMLIHTRVKSFRCFACEETFPTVAERKEHEKTHASVGPFNCELCDKTFESFASFKRHKLFHTQDKIYTCPICSKTFARLSNLKIHRYTHTGEKPYLCKVCARAFGDPSSLQKHEQGHLGLKPHECKICNKRFSRYHHLQEHTRIHTGEKPFLCDICSKAFTKSSSLHKHKLVHKEKAFFCDVCNKPFARRDNMVKHMKGHAKATDGPIEETHKAIQNLQPPYLHAVHMAPPNMEQQQGNSVVLQNYSPWEDYIKLNQGAK